MKRKEDSLMYNLNEWMGFFDGLLRDLAIIGVAVACIMFLIAVPGMFFREEAWRPKNSDKGSKPKRLKASGKEIRFLADQLYEDIEKLLAWEQLHQFGPRTQEERAEHDELLACVITSRMLLNDARDEPIFDPSTNQQLEDFEDWRNG